MFFSVSPLLAQEDHVVSDASAPSGSRNDREQGNWPLNILHERIDLDLTLGDIISGHCTITAVPRDVGTDHFPLQLLALTVDSVTSNSGPFSFTQQAEDLDILFPDLVEPTDTIRLTVHYHGDPVIDQSGFGGFYTSAPYKYNLGVAFTSQPHSFGRAWFPCVDNFTERCSFEFHVKTAGGNNAWCNGALVDELALGGDTIVRHWAIEETMPAYLASVASSNYAVVRDTFPSTGGGSIPVALVARPADTTNMKNSFVNLHDAFDTFEEWFGPYRWNKVGFVLTPQGAMEHSTSIHYPASIANGTLSYENIMAHELAHHWFGDLVTCERAEEMYINEGFAEYLSYLFLESEYGPTAYRNTVRANHRKMLKQAHYDDEGWWALAEMPQEWTYGEHTYNKGADVVHTLRSYMGDEQFRAGFTSFLESHAFKSVNTATMRDHLQTVTGVQLTDFFDDWVLQPGWAAFEVDSFSVNPNPLPGGYHPTEVFVSQKQRGPASAYHNVPVTLSFMDPSGNTWVHPLPVMVGNDQCTVGSAPPFIPKSVLLNVDERISLAVTSDTDHFAMPMTRIYINTDLRVTVNSTPSPFSIRIEEYWVAADDETNEPYAYVVSPDRYWRVLGNIPPTASLSARFVYDGRPAPMISFDTGLMQDFQGVIFREDSLVLLYRPDATWPWSRHPEQSLSVVGSATDKVGRIDIDGFRGGEYAFAWRKSSTGLPDGSARRIQWNIKPNPASERVLVEQGGAPVAGTVELMDGHGRLVRWAPVRSQQVELGLSGVPAGNYNLRFSDSAGTHQRIGKLVVQ